MFNTIAGKRIAVLGFAFKKDTNDTRESAAIDVCRALLAERPSLAIFDPEGDCRRLSCRIWTSATGLDDSRAARTVSMCEPDAYTAADGRRCAWPSSTEWDEFESLDFERIYHTHEEAGLRLRRQEHPAARRDADDWLRRPRDRKAAACCRVERSGTTSLKMRLDLWLDITCLFKTRSEAQKACKNGKVDVNGQPAKPHRDLKSATRSSSIGRSADVSESSSARWPRSTCRRPKPANFTQI